MHLQPFIIILGIISKQKIILILLFAIESIKNKKLNIVILGGFYDYQYPIVGSNLHISGNLPTSFFIPPCCPPIPSPQVLHVFFESIDRMKFLTPTVPAIRRESFMELKPDTALSIVMREEY